MVRSTPRTTVVSPNRFVTPRRTMPPCAVAVASIDVVVTVLTNQKSTPLISSTSRTTRVTDSGVATIPTVEGIRAGVSVARGCPGTWAVPGARSTNRGSSTRPRPQSFSAASTLVHVTGVKWGRTDDVATISRPTSTSRLQATALTSSARERDHRSHGASVTVGFPWVASPQYRQVRSIQRSARGCSSTDANVTFASARPVKKRVRADEEAIRAARSCSTAVVAFSTQFAGVARWRTHRTSTSGRLSSLTSCTLAVSLGKG